MLSSRILKNFKAIIVTRIRNLFLFLSIWINISKVLGKKDWSYMSYAKLIPINNRFNSYIDTKKVIDFTKNNLE